MPVSPAPPEAPPAYANRPTYLPRHAQTPNPPAVPPGGVRGWVIKKLMGMDAEGTPAREADPPWAIPLYPAYQSPPPGAYDPVIPAPSPPYPEVPNGSSPPLPTERPRVTNEPASLRIADDDAGKTRFIGGVDLDKLKLPRHRYMLQILDGGARWRDWGPLHANGLNVGRARSSADFPGLNTMAVRHMKFSYDRGGLMVEDLGSLNGIYLRVTQPFELADGLQFRLGNQRIEFHQAEAFEPVPPTVADDGEEYCSGDLAALAYLDLIRPNARPGLRFPITQPDATVIGREGPGVHIALTGDNSVSGTHARIWRKDGTFFLEDLGSRNGTFVHLVGSNVVKSGDVLLAGRVLFRVVDYSAG